MKKYRYGKSIDPWSVGQQETLFAGRRVVQHHDYCVTVSMDEYVKNKLRPIEVPKGICQIPKKLAKECSPTSRESMVVWAAPHSIIPFGYDRISSQLISEVNAAVRQCQAVPITITIWPLPFDELRWTTFTDSSFDTGEP